MANEVYANGREISCKQAAGKSICAFPDVCLSPPSPPAGPIPIPYPNTAYASDTTDGSKTVQISGAEVMLKDSSYFKQSTGDEAATRTLGMGVITHTIQGKVFFTSWSMDVQIEGENVVRHLDLTTHNHMSKPGNTPPWPYTDSMAMASDSPCADDKAKEEKACKGYKPKGNKDPCPKHSPPQPSKTLRDLKKCQASLKKQGKVMSGADKQKLADLDGKFKARRQTYYQSFADETQANGCLRARRCRLVPYKPRKGEGRCCKGQTGHHVVDASSFFTSGRGNKGRHKAGCSGYETNRAPCICAEGPDNTTASHGRMHSVQGYLNKQKDKGGAVSYAQARNSGAQAVADVFPESDCSTACVKAQLDYYHGEEAKPPVDPQTRVRSAPSGRHSKDDYEAAKALRQQVAPSGGDS